MHVCGGAERNSMFVCVCVCVFFLVCVCVGWGGVWGGGGFLALYFSLIFLDEFCFGKYGFTISLLCLCFCLLLSFFFSFFYMCNH